MESRFVGALRGQINAEDYGRRSGFRHYRQYLDIREGSGVIVGNGGYVVAEASKVGG